MRIILCKGARIDGFPHTPRAEHVPGEQVAGPQLSLGTHPIRKAPPAPIEEIPHSSGCISELQDELWMTEKQNMLVF